jgi:hypothetical protein
MATIIPAVAGNTASATTQAAMNAFYTAFNANRGGFDLINYIEAGGNVEAFTAEHADGWQINFRLTSNTIRYVIAPNGGILDSTDPLDTSPTDASAEFVGIANVATASTRFQFAQYGDAILIQFNNAANTFTFESLHIGAIIAEGDRNSGLRGLGALAGSPAPSAFATTDQWFSTSITPSQRRSIIQTAPGQWASPTLPLSTGSLAAGQTARRVHLVPISAPDTTATAPNTLSPVRGSLKYLRMDTTTTAGNALTVLPSASNNQGWLRISNTTGGTRMVILWNKTVTP